MRQLISYLKIAAFVVGTLALYSFFWILRPIIPNKLYWRQIAFRTWSAMLLRLANVRLNIVGTPPAAPFFLVSNHLGYIDVPVLRIAANGIFVAKSEVESWPVAGKIIRDMGIIFIDRNNRRDIPRAGEQITKRLEAGEGVVVFAEGKIGNGSSVLPFNSSFLQFPAASGIPVSSATLHYETFPGDPPASKVVVWWEEISFMAHLRRLFTLKGFTATVTFGDEPILDADRKELARRLHESVVSNFRPIE